MSLSDSKFTDLKPGEKVLVETKVRGGYRYERLAIVEQTVVRVTKTQFVTHTGTRFMLQNGREVGATSGRDYAYPVGFMKGNGWGKDPTPMVATPTDEIEAWKERCAVAAAFEGLVFKIQRNSRRISTQINDPELMAKLNDTMPVLKELLKRIER